MNSESNPRSSTVRANALMPRARSGPSPSQMYDGRNTPNRPTSAICQIPPYRCHVRGSATAVDRVTLVEEGRARLRACRRWRRRVATRRSRPPGPSPMSVSTARSMRRFASRTATGPRRAISSPISVARATASPAGTTSWTRPMRSASAAVRTLPVRISSLARAGPTMRGSRCVPPAPGVTARRTSGSPSFARVRGDPQVTAQGELQAAAQGVALDGRDGRHRQLGQPPRDAGLQLVARPAAPRRAAPRTRRRASRRRRPARPRRSRRRPGRRPDRRPPASPGRPRRPRAAPRSRG